MGFRAEAAAFPSYSSSFVLLRYYCPQPRSFRSLQRFRLWQQHRFHCRLDASVTNAILLDEYLQACTESTIGKRAANALRQSRKMHAEHSSSMTCQDVLYSSPLTSQSYIKKSNAHERARESKRYIPQKPQIPSI